MDDCNLHVHKLVGWMYIFLEEISIGRKNQGSVQQKLRFFRQDFFVTEMDDFNGWCIGSASICSFSWDLVRKLAYTYQFLLAGWLEWLVMRIRMTSSSCCIQVSVLTVVTERGGVPRLRVALSRGRL